MLDKDEEADSGEKRRRPSRGKKEGAAHQSIERNWIVKLCPPKNVQNNARSAEADKKAEVAKRFGKLFGGIGTGGGAGNLLGGGGGGSLSGTLQNVIGTAGSGSSSAGLGWHGRARPRVRLTGGGPGNKPRYRRHRHLPVAWAAAVRATALVLGSLGSRQGRQHD